LTGETSKVLTLVFTDLADSTAFKAVTNWFEELERLAPVRESNDR